MFGFQSGKQKFPGFGLTHNWVKRSIFWELPYWKTNLFRHNLDVMHIEKNVFENIFNTVVTPGHRSDRLKINHKWKKNIYLASCFFEEKVLFKESPPGIMVTRNPNWSIEIIRCGTDYAKRKILSPLKRPP